MEMIEKGVQRDRRRRRRVERVERTWERLPRSILVAADEAGLLIPRKNGALEWPYGGWMREAIERCIERGKIVLLAGGYEQGQRGVAQHMRHGCVTQVLPAAIAPVIQMLQKPQPHQIGGERIGVRRLRQIRNRWFDLPEPVDDLRRAVR